MTSRDFCYWLQGYFEIDDAVSNHPGEDAMTGAQVKLVRSHLAMVFKHEIDPSFGDQKHVDELTKIHQGVTSAQAVFNC